MVLVDINVGAGTGTGRPVACPQSDLLWVVGPHLSCCSGLLLHRQRSVGVGTWENELFFTEIVMMTAQMFAFYGDVS